MIFMALSWFYQSPCCHALTEVGTPVGQERVKDLLAELTGLAAPGSLLLMDYLHSEVLNGIIHPHGFELAQQVGQQLYSAPPLVLARPLPMCP